MEQNKLLQDSFIQELIDEKMSVSIFLMNGIKLHGIISGGDENVVMLKNAITQMVFKHAISTIVPAKDPQPHTGS